MNESDLHYGFSRCFFGWLVVVAGAHGVRGIFLGDDRERLHGEVTRRFPRSVPGDVSAGGHLALLITRVTRYIDSSETEIDFSLDIQGTPFQLRVWQMLRLIPPGDTWSYGELARRCGVPRGARAVAAACAANPLAVVIPCHRVVRSDGSLCGYHWGIERKRALLEREAACNSYT